VLAAFSLLACGVLLGLIALLGLKPWQDDSVEPRLGPLGLEMAVGDSVALPAAPAAFVADAVVAPGKAKLVFGSVGSQARGRQPVTGLAVGPARAVAVSATEPEPAQTPAPASPAPEAQPVAAPAPAAAPAPVTDPIVAAGERPPSNPRGPITSGGGGFEESCEGDTYVLAISFTGEESSSGESPVKIVLQRLNDDGTVDELELEGDLVDAQELLAQLTSEGNCVEVEIVPDEPAEPAPPPSPVEPPPSPIEP
jgi:hypothetical protein